METKKDVINAVVYFDIATKCIKVDENFKTLPKEGNFIRYGRSRCPVSEGYPRTGLYVVGKKMDNRDLVGRLRNKYPKREIKVAFAYRVLDREEKEDKLLLNSYKAYVPKE